ncbi:MAG: DUF6067 family protein, partial [Bacteroidota bacterium]|nr:DUF6067 family protein [Bacteroidota bacterium]
MKRIIFLTCFAAIGSAAFAQDAAVKYISTRDAVHQYANKIKQQVFLVFPDDRQAPIQWFDSLKLKWLEAGYSPDHISMHAQPGEYFVFQTGIWAIRQNLNHVHVYFSDLKTKGGDLIAAGAATCFNTGGIDYQGHPFTQNVNVPANDVQALWMGIGIPDAAKGDYAGQIIVEATVMGKAGSFQTVSKKITIQITVSGDSLPDHGFDEGSRLSRMAWLNSTNGMDAQVPKEFQPVSRNERVLAVSGRSLQIADDGLPEKITSYFTPSNQSVSAHGDPVLDDRFRFVIEKENGELIHLKPGKLSFLRQSPSAISWKVTSESDDCDLICEAELQFDGFVNYHLTVRAKRKLNIRDIRLEVPLNRNKATYMMGLNKEGGTRPEHWQWKWDTTKNQDALWLGAVNGGLRIKWKAENYRLPLVNIYYAFGPLNLPPSWGNAGKGGVNIYERGKEVMVNAYSG